MSLCKASQNAIKFFFYGFGIEVKCQDAETLREIRRDYSYFINDNVAAAVAFEISNEPPGYSRFPAAKAYLYTSHNVCYRDNGLIFIDYFGKGLVVIDQKKNIYKVFCPDPQLRHEILYLYIAALVGKNLGLKNLHRVHGLGLEVNRGAVLILLPSGGGKTTLMLDLLKGSPVKFFSEDSPLIDAGGRMHPFPVRIGVKREDKPKDIPDEHLHLFERIGFGPKYTIDINFFKDRIAAKPLAIRYVFCGGRCLSNQSSIQPIPRSAALREFTENCVRGIGLYEGAEFLIQRGLRGLIIKSPVLFSRFRNTLAALSRAKTYSFMIGSDRKQNVKTFLDFFKDTLPRLN